MKDGKLRPIDERSKQAVLAVERAVIRKMRRYVEQGALDASRINDNGLDDSGSEVFLNERRKRIAMDLRKSKRHAPVYLDVYKARVEAAERLDAERAAPRGDLNIGVFVEVKPVIYPTLALDTKKETE